MSEKIIIKQTNGIEWFCNALTILFITLKLTNVIMWSWWWVLAPIWIPISIGLIIGAIYLLWFAKNI